MSMIVHATCEQCGKRVWEGRLYSVTVDGGTEVEANYLCSRVCLNKWLDTAEPESDEDEYDEYDDDDMFVPHPIPIEMDDD